MDDYIDFSVGRSGLQNGVERRGPKRGPCEMRETLLRADRQSLGHGGR